MTTTTERPRTTTSSTAVGQAHDRRDGGVKTSGAAEYSADRHYAGLVHAALVHSDIPRGTITAIHAEEALGRDGVLAVLTHENAPRMQPPPKPSMVNMATMVSPIKVNLLNTDEVWWNGQPVAVVVAETHDAAINAASVVRVEYRAEPAETDFAAQLPRATLGASSVVARAEQRKGDAEAALAAAPVAVDLRFTTPMEHHNAIEPHATTAIWAGDRLTVHDATQSIDWARQHLALRFGVPLANVKVVAPYVGGGFGGKGAIWPATLLAALTARAVQRPVRLALPRAGVYRTVGGRTPTVQRVALGATSGGLLTALVHEGTSQITRIGGNPEPTSTASEHLYAAQAIHLRNSVVTLDALPSTFMRAPGHAPGSFAVESAMDQLAFELGMDPVELRMRNEPTRGPLDGKPFSHRRVREMFARGAAEFGWAERTPAMRDGRWLVGWGTAAAYHPGLQLASSLTVRLAADGSALVRCGFHEMGMGTATAQAQIAADALGLPYEAVRMEYGDSTLPVAPMAGGSNQTVSIAASMVEAGAALRQAVLRLAGPPLRGLRPGDVVARGGGLYPRAGGPGASYVEILGAAGRDAVEVSVGSDTRLGRITGQARMMARMVREQRRWVKASTGAHFCEVRVDPDTFEVRVSRWVGAFDIGRVVNTKLAASQMRGGIVMGIGMALSEETLVDPRTGRIVNPSLSEYHVPVHADVPPIAISFLDDPDPTMPLGVLGAGEVSITGVAAAVANAVFHATGKRVRDLPITLDKLLSVEGG